MSAAMAKSTNPFRYFDSSPEVIRLVVMMYVRYPLSLRNVEDLPFERGIGVCHETVRLWWNRFGPMCAGEIRRKRVDRWLNNRAENSHQPFRPRERAMERFWRMETLRKFSSVHASVHNHFNQERHLISRDLYRERRSAALAEWRTLAA
jgi:transposase-like protein